MFSQCPRLSPLKSFYQGGVMLLKRPPCEAVLLCCPPLLYLTSSWREAQSAFSRDLCSSSSRLPTCISQLLTGPALVTSSPQTSGAQKKRIYLPVMLIPLLASGAPPRVSQPHSRTQVSRGAAADATSCTTEEELACGVLALKAPAWK